MRVERRPRPECGPGEIILEVAACGICGTDLLKLEEKSVPDGTVLGHEVAGTVVQAGSDVARFQEGDRVTVAHHVPCYTCHYCRRGSHTMCRSFKKSNLDPGGFADYLRIPSEHVAATAYPIPDSLTFDEAIFMEPLGCCIRNLQRLPLMPGDTVTLIGLGSIGLMMTDLLRNIPVNVIGIDKQGARLELARQRGAKTLFDGFTDGGHKRVMELTDGRGADAVIFTAGHAGLLTPALDWLRDGGTLNLFASLERGDLPLLLPNLYHREISLIPTYSATPEALEESLQLIAARKVEVASLVTHRLALEEILAGVDLLRKQEALKVIVTPKDKR